MRTCIFTSNSKGARSVAHLLRVSLNILADQADLCPICSETPKTGCFTMQLNYSIFVHF